MTNGRSSTLGKAARSSWSGRTGESRRFRSRLGPATGEWKETFAGMAEHSEVVGAVCRGGLWVPAPCARAAIVLLQERARTVVALLETSRVGGSTAERGADGLLGCPVEPGSVAPAWLPGEVELDGNGRGGWTSVRACRVLEKKDDDGRVGVRGRRREEGRGGLLF